MTWSVSKHTLFVTARQRGTRQLTLKRNAYQTQGKVTFLKQGVMTQAIGSTICFIQHESDLTEESALCSFAL